MRKALRVLAVPGVIAGLLALSVVSAPVASAQSVNLQDCTNFYPELCMNPDGSVNEQLFLDALSNGDVEGYLLEAQVAEAIKRHLAGDDTDGNGIPDSPEIALCGSAGCLPKWAETQKANMSPALTVHCCDGKYQADINTINLDISKGMNPNKLVSVFTLSTPVVHYVGAYPSGGMVKMTFDPPSITLGAHKVFAVGTASGAAKPNVLIWDLTVLPEEVAAAATTTPTTAATAATVANATQSNSAAATATSAAPAATTGSNTKVWVSLGAALVLLGSALVVGSRRRRQSADA